MHEQSYVNHLVQRIDLVMRENPTSRITGITVRLGALSLLSPEYLERHLATAMQDRLGENADIRIVLDGDPESPEALEAVIEAIDFDVTPLEDAGAETSWDQDADALPVVEEAEVIEAFAFFEGQQGASSEKEPTPDKTKEATREGVPT